MTFLSAGLFGQTAGAVNGQVSGRIQVPDGTPLANAIVTVRTTQDTGGKPQNVNAKTDANGAFTLDSISAGTYRVCVQSARKDFLNPCTWFSAAITVNAGQSLSAGTIRLTSGHLLRVHITDNGKALASQKGAISGQLSVGIWSNDGFFTPMPFANGDGNGRDYEIYVPGGAPLNVSVASNLVDLADDSGAAVDKQKGSAKTIQVPAGPNPTVINYRVTGVRNGNGK